MHKPPSSIECGGHEVQARGPASKIILNDFEM